ncbi:nucleoside triphosphate pyrophosphohydrolase [Streptomyces sp. NPDC092359]|uniref:nucleoside triphosphate pyrophosphohydrolase n=1 Tax=Streptomyces sp. NPDC092359 TaxID=3366014 RepID=UPI00381576E4
MAETDGKLVRDRIAEIILDSGVEPVTYVAEPEEYSRRLRDKLREEVTEFFMADEASPSDERADLLPEELADILEVVRALAMDVGSSVEQVEAIRVTKAKERGGFADRIVWTGNL